MAARRIWLLPLTLLIVLGLMSTVQRARAHPVDEQPSVTADGFEPPPPNQAFMMIAEDTSFASFQESFADGDPQTTSSSSTAASGTILKSDNFSDAAAGILPRSSSRPDQWKIGYLNGEYQIATRRSGVDLTETALTGGTYADVSVTVTVRLIHDIEAAADQTIRIYCRRQTAGTGFTGYRFQYTPLINAFAIYRGDGNTGLSLTDVQYIRVPPVGFDAHTVVLTCAGSTISASVDGKPVASVRDASYHDGRVALGVGSFTRWDPGGIVSPETAYPGTYDSRFSKLVLSQP